MNTQYGKKIIGNESLDATQKQVAGYEQQRLSGAMIKARTASELCTEFNSILSNHDICTDKMKFI